MMKKKPFKRFLDVNKWTVVQFMGVALERIPGLNLYQSTIQKWCRGAMPRPTFRRILEVHFPGVKFGIK